MATYNGLPLFILGLGDDTTGVEIISLVDRPAVERNFIKFSNQVEVKFKVDEDKHIVTGPALIPGKKIYRRDDETGYEYYVEFTKEGIQQIAEKFFADHNSTNVNLQHELDVNGCVYFESYFINSERGILPAEFADLPEGTWIVSCKINNEGVWDMIKKGELRGFSIEGYLDVQKPEEKTLDTIQDLLDYLKR